MTGSVLVLATWATVFEFNLAVPVLFGWELVREDGIIGLGFAVLLLFIAGGLVCRFHREVAMPLIAGRGGGQYAQT